MSKLNTRPARPVPLTFGGAPAASPPTALAALRRAVLSCLLWEDQFYESDVAIATRMRALIAECTTSDVAALAAEARTTHGLRHVPLLLIAELVTANRKPTSAQVAAVLQRADEMGELVAMLWRDGKRPLPHAVKRAIGQAFNRQTAYTLAKWDSSRREIRMRDLLRLTHPVPKDEAQSALFKQVLEDTLPVPNTWETRLSAGEDKRTVWESLLREGQLGYLALLRNLRNMESVAVDRSLVVDAIVARQNGADKVWPFRFIAAARNAVSFTAALDEALRAHVADLPRFPGKTVVLVDVSGSMKATLSSKSDLTRMDAAAALAVIFPSVDVEVYSFSDLIVQVPGYRGLAGVDAIRRSQQNNGTALAQAVQYVNGIPHDRLIVITDEQATDGKVPDPRAERAYLINVASYQNGVRYDRWTKIDGFSESVLRYMFELEQA